MNTLLVFVVVVLYINNLNLAEVSESPTMPCFLLPFLVLVASGGLKELEAIVEVGHSSQVKIQEFLGAKPPQHICTHLVCSYVLPIVYA